MVRNRMLLGGWQDLHNRLFLLRAIWVIEDMNILETISDPAMRALAMKQLKCIAEL